MLPRLQPDAQDRAQPYVQDRVVILLVRARNPANIGAVARAMHDFGFSQLRIVNDYDVPLAAARVSADIKSAVHSTHILDAATEHKTVAEAVADCTLVLGTTAVGARVMTQPLHTLAEAAAEVGQALAHPRAKVALLFGSEKTGLSNDELSHCHALLTIPMNTRTADRHLSMNLGQAAAVCLYELSRGSNPPPPSPQSEPATAGDFERVSMLLREVLDRSGYSRRHPANARENQVRALVVKMGLEVSQVVVWMGILRQILHAIPGSRPPGPTDI